MKAKQAKKIWSDASLLKAISNPSARGIEIKHRQPEFTFFGAKDQPDCATIDITFYPKTTVIELRSLKLYLQQFRNEVLSYERIMRVIYDDLMAVYKPARLRIVMVTKPRGGISSRITLDSDWKIMGGKERFKDWVGQREEW